MNADLPLSSTPRTILHRLRERGSTDRRDLYAVLDPGLVCHLGVIIDGAPVVLPTGYGRIDDTLYLHGSSANRSLLAADGQQVCVTVIHLDGLVCARSVFHHSMNYRSAVIFGAARLLTDDAERLAGLRAVTHQLVPGRWGHGRPPTAQGLARPPPRAPPLAGAAGGGVGQDPDRAAQGRRRGLRKRHLGGRASGRADLRRSGARPGPARGHR